MELVTTNKRCFGHFLLFGVFIYLVQKNSVVKPDYKVEGN